MGKAIAKIYLSNFEHNIHEVRKLAPNKKICLAMKANAYGHGAIPIANKAINLGVEYLSIATVDEGIELREAGITAPILLLSLCHEKEIIDLVSYNITPLVSDTHFIDLLYESLMLNKQHNFPVHIKVDTGMSRHGVSEKDALHLARYIESKEVFFIEGTCTHFAVSDSILEEDKDFTIKQLECFNTIIKILRDNNINPGILHCSASGGILLYPQAHFDMVRPGIMAYGYYPSPELSNYFSSKKGVNLIPVMELIAYVVAIKIIDAGTSVSYGRTWIATEEKTIATLSIGYGDGLNRLLSGNSEVTIHNDLYPLIGRICMDQCVVELNKNHKVSRWSEAVIFGPKLHCNTAQDIAIKTNTIPYEVLCLITNRVKREYI